MLNVNLISISKFDAIKSAIEVDKHLIIAESIFIKRKFNIFNLLHYNECMQISIIYRKFDAIKSPIEVDKHLIIAGSIC